MLLFCVILNSFKVDTKVDTIFFNPAKFDSWEEGSTGGEPKSSYFFMIQYLSEKITQSRMNTDFCNQKINANN
jgi:hypothetical protein